VDAEALLASQTTHQVDLVGEAREGLSMAGARAEWLCFSRFLD
jgi:hypothetical protein